MNSCNLVLYVQFDRLWKRTKGSVTLVLNPVCHVHPSNGQTFSDYLLVARVDPSRESLSVVIGVQGRGHEHIFKAFIWNIAIVSSQMPPDDREASLQGVWPPRCKLYEAKGGVRGSVGIGREKLAPGIDQGWEGAVVEVSVPLSVSLTLVPQESFHSHSGQGIDHGIVEPAVTILW